MANLLSANLLRLWRSKSFWGSMGVSLGMAIFMVLDDYRSAQQFGRAAAPDSELFKYAVFIGFLAGELIPLFFGTEYSDGAIRNKLVVGHSRIAIYFANFITSFAACLLCSAAYILGCVGLGIPLLGRFSQPLALLLTALLGVLLMTAAFCAVFNFVTMNCSRKSNAVMVCLLGTFLILIAAIYLYQRLDAPEFIEGYTLIIEGQVTHTDAAPNPQFLQGMEREVFQFAYDLLPTGQSLQYGSLTFTDPARLMGLSAAVTAVFSAAGCALFRRKDLK